jgi:peptidoglycan/LPS O-acetylase OafA/YrhL
MGALAPLVLNGWAGVDLFFALSGFLITWLILREEDAHGRAEGARWFSLRAFYLRRALRILPPFLCVLALNLTVFGALHLSSVTLAHATGRTYVMGVLAYGTFWGNYYRAWLQEVDPGQAFTVFWSLCVEEHFYLLWPPALTLVRGRRGRLLLGSSICAALLALRYVVSALDLDHANNVHFLSHYRLDSILWGATAALGADLLAGRPRARAAALAASAAVLATVMGLRHPGAATPLQQSLGLTALATTASLIVLEVACRPRAWIVRLLETAPLRAVGKVSYGMYLLHFQVMELAWPLVYRLEPASSLAGYLAAFAIVSAAVYGSAALMYRYVERPFLVLKDTRYAAPRLALEAPAATAAAAPAAVAASR